MEIIWFIIGLLSGGVIAWLVCNHVKRKECDEQKERLIQMDRDLDHEQKMAEFLRRELEKKETVIESSKKRELELSNESKVWETKAQNSQDDLSREQKKLGELKQLVQLEFKNMAAEIMDEKSKKFTIQNQNSLKEILNPLNERLEGFKTIVKETYNKESKERFSLEKEVIRLQELNTQISVDATNLTKALKGDSKIQGDWGQMILENLLENSGLQKGSDYLTQSFIKDYDDKYLKGPDGKKMQPDVIVNYPGNRSLIIDAKVSLTAFSEYTSSDEPEIQKGALKRHINSIRNHLRDLSGKQYDNFDRSLDFVLMFIPIEPAFLAALKTEPSLWEEAYRKRIIIISPTNLYAALKMIEDLWKREKQSENIKEIVNRATLLYEKFTSLYVSMEELDQSLSKSREKFDKAVGQLKTGKGNLLGQVKKLEELGLNPKKRLPSFEKPDNPV